MLVELIDHTSIHLPSVKTLGRKNAATLGFFPEGAFEEYARKRQIIVAVDDQGQCVGYVLYRLSNRTAKIVHLCVDSSNRSAGVARSLIEALKTQTKDLIGISLRCRKDYLANKIWPKFGFVNYGEKPGRGKDGAVLVIWRLDNGHPTLFDISVSTDESDKLDIIVDANVFFDFFDKNRPGNSESRILMADWLDELIQIGVVDEILNDIGRSNSSEIRQRSRAQASAYIRQGCIPEEVDGFVNELRTHFLVAKPILSDQDESDIRHLAKTICSKVSFFVTRDERLIEIMSDFVTRRFNLQIVRPSDFVKKIDEIRRERDYQPANLCGTEIQRVLVKAGEDTELIELFHQSENRSNFQDRFRGFVANVNDFECNVIRESSGNPIGLLIFDSRDPTRLRIPIVRAKRGSLERTIVRNMIALSINHAIVKSRLVVEFIDPVIGDEIENALLEEGFLRSKNSWVKFQVKATITKDEFASYLQSYKGASKEEEIFLRQTHNILTKDALSIPREFFGEMERLFFPLKISDSPIPTYLISIKPGWAKELFDSALANRGLYTSKEDVALRREQVYYRSPLNSGGIRAPARIIWYVTESQPHLPETRSVRAVSQIYEVVVDKPKALFKRFSRLGIYEWKNVYDLAKQDIENEVMAIRFGNTQLFSESVSLDELKKILYKYSTGLQLQSPFEIPSAAFIEIYDKGI